MEQVCCSKRKKGKLYAGTDVSITIKLNEGVSIDINDISDIHITLTETWSEEEVIFSMLGGEVIFYAGEDNDEPKHFLLNIDKEDITMKGKYKISVIIEDIEGNVRGLTPCPSTLLFE